MFKIFKPIIHVDRLNTKSKSESQIPKKLMNNSIDDEMYQRLREASCGRQDGENLHSYMLSKLENRKKNVEKRYCNKRGKIFVRTFFTLKYWQQRIYDKIRLLSHIVESRQSFRRKKK